MACTFPGISPDEIRFYARIQRSHFPRQNHLIARCTAELGCINPFVVDLPNAIVAHHRRRSPACRVELPTVSVMRAEPRPKAQSLTYRSAENCLVESAVSDREQLRVAVGHLTGSAGYRTAQIVNDLGAVRQTILGTEPRAHRRDRCNSSRSIRSFWRETA